MVSRSYRLDDGAVRIIRTGGEVIIITRDEVEGIRSMYNDRGVLAHLERHSDLSMAELRKAGAV
jgi:hypothetical protein